MVVHPRLDGAIVANVGSPPDSGRNRCSAEVGSSVPEDEIATAIARCAGCLADGVATVGSIDSGEREPSITGAIHYGGGIQIFFDR